VDHVPEVTVLMSGDEEAGSHAVQERIIEEGRKADWCIVTEGARENGAIVIERKGNSYFHVRASGRAAHAGIEPEKGRNAIEELALKIVKLRALNDFDRGSTVTIGTINGGENRIVVAESAEMDIDLRYRTKEDGEMLIRQVRDILEQVEIHGVRTEYTFTRNRPPLVQVEGSAQLQRLAKEASQELGIPYLTAVTGGVSDGNFVADIGTPTIDGLGPVGGMMCSPEEYLCLDSMTERIARMGTVVGMLGCLEDVVGA
jgi:glutamate carboxypeptidase